MPELPTAGEATTPWVRDLIARFRRAGGSIRECDHLAEDPEQGAVWLASVPDRRTCRRAACTSDVVSASGRARGDEPPRCTTCGATGVPVRGVGVAVGTTMLRGTVCDPCLAERPTIEPEVVEGEGPVARRPLAIQDDPLIEGPGVAEADDAEPETPDVHDLARRALRRAALMADACCRATPDRLGPDHAVAAGLLARAAELSGDLAAGSTPDGSLLHDVGLGALDEATSALRRAAGDAQEGTPPAVPTQPPEDRWAALAAPHLTDGPDGAALAPRPRPAAPLRTILAAERLALACVDHAERLLPHIDPDDVRRHAAELSDLRRTVEVARANAGDDVAPASGATVEPPARDA
jgi:hypothetical protein